MMILMMFVGSVFERRKKKKCKRCGGVKSGIRLLFKDNRLYLKKRKEKKDNRFYYFECLALYIRQYMVGLL